MLPSWSLQTSRCARAPCGRGLRTQASRRQPRRTHPADRQTELLAAGLAQLSPVRRDSREAGPELIVRAAPCRARSRARARGGTAAASHPEADRPCARARGARFAGRIVRGQSSRRQPLKATACLKGWTGSLHHCARASEAPAVPKNLVSPARRAKSRVVSRTRER